MHPATRTLSKVEHRPIVRLLQAANICFARIYHRVDVISPCRLPRHGPAILVCNHISGLDPVMIQSVCPRLIVWMMAREYYEQPALNWIFKQILAIPVSRSGQDLSATRQAMRALRNGHVLGVFPEGRLEEQNELLPFQTGAAVLAEKTGAPVYPAHIEGTARGMRCSAHISTLSAQSLLLVTELVFMNRTNHGTLLMIPRL